MKLAQDQLSKINTDRRTEEGSERAGFAVSMASDGAKRFPTATIIDLDTKRIGQIGKGGTINIARNEAGLERGNASKPCFARPQE